MKAPLTLVLMTLSVALAFAACGHKKPRVEEPVVEPDAGGDGEADGDAAPPPSLYQRLGGKDGVAAVIESFVGNVSADKRINKLFAKTTGPKLDHFKQMLAEQICSVTDGGCTYSGKNMKDAHKGMGISEAQFMALVEDLALALEEKQVSKDDEAELLNKLATLKDDVVEKKDKPKK
jgi:hemoglobin